MKEAVTTGLEDIEMGAAIGLVWAINKLLIANRI